MSCLGATTSSTEKAMDVSTVSAVRRSPSDIDAPDDIDADGLAICIAEWDTGLGSDAREDLDRDASITVVDVFTLLSS